MSKTLLDAPIYINTYRLAGIVYDLRFALPKRDRAVLGERMLDAVMGMLSDFTMSYKLRGVDKVIHTDKFLAHFEVLKGLMRMCADRKLFTGEKKEKKFTSTFEYIKRIDDGIIAWREKLSREVRSTKASNDGLRSGIRSKLRGGAIGFLIWQNAMGRYINDVVRWMESLGFMRVVVFVDDIYIVTKDKAKFLAVIPELRRRLAELKVSLNERKFYLQHYSKGVRILGSHVKYDREILDRSTVRRAFRKVEEWKRVNGIQWKTDRLLSSMNTYVEMMKHKTMRRTTERFRDCVLDSFGRFLGWNPQKECFCLKEKYTLKRVLERKYKVRL